MFTVDAKCSSCTAPIRWAKTAAGKRIPIDARPAGDGNLVLTHGGAVAVAYNADLHIGNPRYRSHFSSCPNAGQHRRPR